MSWQNQVIITISRAWNSGEALLLRIIEEELVIDLINYATDKKKWNELGFFFFQFLLWFYAYVRSKFTRKLERGR